LHGRHRAPPLLTPSCQEGLNASGNYSDGSGLGSATNVQGPDGALKLPADGNPFPAIEGAQQGGLFAR
jgi:hypothetical protein